jgi:hypothetical protein
MLSAAPVGRADGGKRWAVSCAAVAMDWVTPAGSGVVAVAGLVFGWATTVRSQRQTAELAREGNRHAQALAELTGDQQRRLEVLRQEQAGRDRRERRLEESYVEVATAVVRLSATVEGIGDGQPEDLVRARVLVGLFARGDVRDAFDNWLDSFDKLRFALARQLETVPEAPPASVRDLHSPTDLWRRQAGDARLREVDARERLMAAMAGDLGLPAVAEPGP